MTNNPSNNIKKVSNDKINSKFFKKNNSSKIIYINHKKNRTLPKKLNNSIKNNTKSNKNKSVNKEMIKGDINRISNYNGNKLYNKIIPSFFIDKKKITYNQNTNYIKKISIEGIYYANKKK